MFFTITLQTYNHAEVLARALQSLALLECPADVDYEILVVDNNSADGTAAVIQNYREVLGPRFRSVFEPKQGLSHARNRAIAEAKGDVICFMDDDAMADSRWLAGHVETYRNDDRTVAVGGRVLLERPQGWSRPPWFSADLEGYLSGVDLGSDGGVMQFPSYPYGCNMSVRRELAERVGGFCVRLGRTGSNLISNEEKHFFYTIQKRGERVVYAPDALVYHVIPKTRLSRRFFLRRAYAQGVSNVIFQRETQPLASSMGWHIRQIAVGMKLSARAGLYAVGALVSGRWGVAGFHALVRVAYGLGYMIGAAMEIRRARSSSLEVADEATDGG